MIALLKPKICSGKEVKKMNEKIFEDELTFTLELDRSPGRIARLIAESRYRSVMPGITDENFPLAGSEGIVLVRFRIVRGSEIKDIDLGHVGPFYGDMSVPNQVAVTRHFRSRGMRFPYADEALLPCARNHELARDSQRSLVAFIKDSEYYFSMHGVYEHPSVSRHISRYKIAGDCGGTSADYLGVCERDS